MSLKVVKMTVTANVLVFDDKGQALGEIPVESVLWEKNFDKTLNDVLPSIYQRASEYVSKEVPPELLSAEPPKENPTPSA